MHSLCSSRPCQSSTYMPQCRSDCFPTLAKSKSHHTWHCSHSGKALSFRSLCLLWRVSGALELLPLRHGSAHLASGCYPRLLPPLTAASVPPWAIISASLAFCIKISPIAASLYFPWNSWAWNCQRTFPGVNGEHSSNFQATCRCNCSL